MNRIFYWIVAILLFINALAGFAFFAIFLSPGLVDLTTPSHSPAIFYIFGFLTAFSLFSPFSLAVLFSTTTLSLLIFFSIFFIIWGILYLSFARGKREINIFSNISLIFLVLLLFSHILSFLLLRILHPGLFTEQIPMQTPRQGGLAIIGYYLIYYFSFLVASSIIGIILTIIGFIKGKKSNLTTPNPNPPNPNP